MKCSTSTLNVGREKWDVRPKLFGVQRPTSYVLLSMVFVPLSTALACTLCKEALPTGMARGFYWSILLMLAVPTIVVVTIAGAVWRAGKKRRGLPNAHHE